MKNFLNVRNILIAVAGVAVIFVLAVVGMGIVAGGVVGSRTAHSPLVNTSYKIASAPPPGWGGWTLPKPAHMPSNPQQAAMVKRGAFLVMAGDCMPCHSVSGEPAFAGGRAVGTPFGAIYSRNITSSKRYGIGSWTDKQFWTAIHDGISPGRSLLVFPNYLYPLMPYNSYSQISYNDVMAIKAYLESLPPARIKNRPKNLYFPTNLRAGLLAWRFLYFRPHKLHVKPGWSESVTRGAYIVHALEHCTECHTPRNIAMASIKSRFLAGGHIVAQGWYAPNITPNKSRGIGGWSDAQLMSYLHGGGDMTHGAPFGKMKSVVFDSLGRLPKADVQDVVNYLRTVKPKTSRAPNPVGAAVAEAGKHDAATIAEGRVVYLSECARCHQKNGEGVANNFPNLAHNEALWDGKPDDVQAMILGGFRPWHKGQSSMPRFGTILSDSQIAAVTNYVRTAWGNKGAADDTANHVALLRNVSVAEVDLDTGTTAAQIRRGTGPQSFQQISGRIDFDGDRVDCRVNAHLSGAKGFKPIHLAGTCDQQGNGLSGRAMIGGALYPVHLRVKQLHSGTFIDGMHLWGPIPGTGESIDAVIHFSTPNY